MKNIPAVLRKEPDDDFVSIVVLSYDRPDFLAKTLQSVVDTADYPYELIVVDDGGSEDAVRRIVGAGESGYLSSTVLNFGQNMGVGVGVNRGFDIAQGRWLVKCDQDIRFRKGWMSAGVRALSDHPEIGCLGFQRTDHPCCRSAENRIEVLPDGVEYTTDFISSVFMTRRPDYDRFGFQQYRIDFAEDVRFKTDVREAGMRVALTAEDYVSSFGGGPPKSTVWAPNDGSSVGVEPDDPFMLCPIADGPRVFRP